MLTIKLIEKTFRSSGHSSFSGNGADNHEGDGRLLRLHSLYQSAPSFSLKKRLKGNVSKTKTRATLLFLEEP